MKYNLALWWKAKFNFEKKGKRMMRLRVLFTVFLICGCLSAQEKTAPPGAQTPAAQPSQTPPALDQSPALAPAPIAPADASLYVYRQRRYEGYALAPSIYVDGVQVTRMANGRHVHIKLTPGTHEIRSDDKSSVISIDAKIGQDYYIRVDEATGFWKGHGRLTLVLPEQGSAEYKVEKPIDDDQKFAKDLIVDDPDNAPPAPKS
ncbi:MAG TPA: DUF2846 domain-containing protein [Candidatus Acidoferrales bacterium]|nr:DUF2846 domain-containing protein [Candidatus Acidoferrales bacterium]